jgi:hypothetical protein
VDLPRRQDYDRALARGGEDADQVAGAERSRREIVLAAEKAVHQVRHVRPPRHAQRIATRRLAVAGSHAISL